jgi:hypothetical protein
MSYLLLEPEGCASQAAAAGAGAAAQATAPAGAASQAAAQAAAPAALAAAPAAPAGEPPRQQEQEQEQEAAVVVPRVLFLYKLAPGAADQSFGLNVAATAGIPGAVVQRAARLAGGMRGRVEGQERGVTGAEPSPRRDQACEEARALVAAAGGVAQLLRGAEGGGGGGGGEGGNGVLAQLLKMQGQARDLLAHGAG